MIVQLTRRAVRVTRPAAITRLRDEFAWQHFVHLPRFLGRGLLEAVRGEIERGAFYERTHAGIGENKELCMQNRTPAGGVLHILLNSEELFEIIRAITRVPAIGCFMGRVYRVSPGLGHRDAWHSDMAAHRLVAMSINLSTSRYRGGVLEMRSVGSRRILRSIPNPGPGDAILFRIARRLEHRITDIEGDASKTAFAGWFQSEPSFRSMVGLESRSTR